jgi:ATP-dependent Clp protease ATP-binding subunit ClpX
MEGILLDTMFELPSLDSVSEIVVNRDVADGRTMPLMIHAERRGDVGSAS